MSGRKVLVVGACGRMVEQVRKWVDAHPSLSLGAALEASNHPAMGETIAPGVTLCSDIDNVIGDADVVIDFTVPDATVKNLQSAARAGVAYVTGTTGLSEEQKAEIHQLIQENLYQTGKLTDVIKLERLDPKAAAKLREEIHYQKHEEVREAEKVGAEKQRLLIQVQTIYGKLR